MLKTVLAALPWQIRAVRKCEEGGGGSSNMVGIMVEIGLTDLPKSTVMGLLHTTLYWWQTSNDKNLAILLQLNAYKGFN